MTLRSGLERYRILGCSGLRVSPLSLGTMTFGSNAPWCTDVAASARMFDMYVDRGGNFIDTANTYTDGAAEELIGRCATGKRDSLVIATKYTFSTNMRDPNSGGNHRKNLMRTTETSLRRLKTDYLDLLYLHAWDDTTPVDEILRGMDDLVRSGKVLYVGVSNIPAWQASRMQAIAQLRGWAPLAALQLEYNLAERTAERELIPMADALGLGVVAWSPLRSGILTGKYKRDDAVAVANFGQDLRRGLMHARGLLTPRTFDIVDVLRDGARAMDITMSQLALAWALNNPKVTALTIGARTVEQFEDNLAALEANIPTELNQRLDVVSETEKGYPHEHLNWWAENGFLWTES